MEGRGKRRDTDRTYIVQPIGIDDVLTSDYGVIAVVVVVHNSVRHHVNQ